MREFGGFPRSSAGTALLGGFEVAEAELLDAVAQRRPLDVEKFSSLRLVAAADFQRPADQIGLDLAQPVVERDRRRVAVRLDDRAPGLRRTCGTAR